MTSCYDWMVDWDGMKRNGIDCNQTEQNGTLTSSIVWVFCNRME